MSKASAGTYQLRRNHSTQYISHPDHPWFKLRKENPGVYESYADLVPGEWTKIKIVVSGTKLFSCCNFLIRYLDVLIKL